MATTIAKLAAVLTTDTAQFDAGMQRATQSVRTFDSAAGKSAVKIANMAGVFGGFGGLIGPLNAFVGPWGILASAIVGAGAAAYRADQHLKQVAENFSDEKIKAMRAYAEAFERLNGVKLGGIGRTSEELKALTDLGRSQIRGEFGKNDLGKGFVSWTIGSKEALAAGEAAQKILNDQKAKTVTLIEQAIEKEKRLAEEQKRLAEEQREAAQKFAQLQARGQSIADSLRTPLEVMRDGFKELTDLAAGGFIEGNTLARGLAKTADDYREASRRMAESQRSTASVGALERGSVAEFSARVKAEAEQKEHTRLLKESVTVEKDIAATLKKIESKPDRGQAIKVARLN